MRFLKFGWGDDDDAPTPKPKANLAEWRERKRIELDVKKPKTSEKTPRKNQRKNRGAKISWTRPNMGGDVNE
jgi:hypothetical protein